MDVLYCLAQKKDNEYKEHSVYLSFESALISVYDIGVKTFSDLIHEQGVDHAKKYVEDLKDMNKLRKGYEPDNVTYLFNKKFRITKVKNRLTSKEALVNIVDHINMRFKTLVDMKTSKRICFPLQLLDEKIKSKWYDLDQFNAQDIIENLEKHLQTKIDELKLHNNEVVQGILEHNNEDFIAVRFTDSQEFLINHEIFPIVVSPSTGYEQSLTSSQS